MRGKHKDKLTGIIKANASTEKRSAITVQQQFRWHSAVDGAFALLRQLNTGLTPSEQTFGEVMPHFVIGGDETCLLASAGDVKVFGDKEKKHHDVTTGSSRTSITLYRTGSAAGTDGPTAFLPPGVRVKSGFTDEFLVKNGAAPGSTIVMTPTGYMTEDAWVELAPKMGKGIRTMPVICENPNWWVCKIIDGFGPHVSSEAAMQIYYDHKIILLKEEGDSSHVNQAYDQEVAKSDKRRPWLERVNPGFKSPIISMLSRLFKPALPRSCRRKTSTTNCVVSLSKLCARPTLLPSTLRLPKSLQTYALS